MPKSGTQEGFGLGLVFVPLSSATFATLAPQMRAEGTSIYSLIRNIGSSIGIAMVQTLLTRNTQIAHAGLTERITLANPALDGQALFLQQQAEATSAAATLLNTEITRQAALIAYLDDFRLMFLITLAILPLLLLLRPQPRTANAPVDAAAME